LTVKRTCQPDFTGVIPFDILIKNFMPNDPGNKVAFVQCNEESGEDPRGN
jgi:hypothetical protein